MHEIRFDNLLTAAQQSDPPTLQLRRRFVRNLAIVVSSTAQLFSANMIIVVGVAGGKNGRNVARGQYSSWLLCTASSG